MKTYEVSIDITMTKIVSVEANNEEEAVRKVNEMITRNPYDGFTTGFSHYVTHELVDVIEE